MQQQTQTVHMPAEWEPHRGMLMEWPVSALVWKEGLMAARDAFAQVAKNIARFEPVTMIANPQLAEQAEAMCGGAVRMLAVEHDDCWARDNCPTFVKDAGGSLLAVNWQFNAWGGIYPDFALDNTVPERLCGLWGIERLDARLVLEGGSIHTNGKGVVLTTEECLGNPNRNPALDRDAIETMILSHLGARRLVWLPQGLYGDETSGHVDNLCCFIEESTVLLLWTEDTANNNYDRVRRAERELKNNGLAVERITQPPSVCYNGKPLPLSYVNFVFVNGGLILPAFGGPAAEADHRAGEQMRSLFPDREIVQLPTMDIIKGGGNIHCITQQIPQ